MKKLIILMMCLIAPVALATVTYTFDATDLASMVVSWESPDGALYLDNPLIVSTNGTYADEMTATTLDVGFEAVLVVDSTDQYYPFTALGIGFPWGSVPDGDLTAYDEYSLTFVNDNDDIWWVNLYLNTGWTDDPWNETDVFTENGWTALEPGELTTLTIDLTSVPNLDHVTNIGFIIAGNLDGVVVGDESNPSSPDAFHVSVSPVPAPGAILLGGIGVSFVGYLRRRRTL